MNQRSKKEDECIFGETKLSFGLGRILIYRGHPIFYNFQVSYLVEK